MYISALCKLNTASARSAYRLRLLLIDVCACPFRNCPPLPRKRARRERILVLSLSLSLSLPLTLPVSFPPCCFRDARLNFLRTWHTRRRVCRVLQGVPAFYE